MAHTILLSDDQYARLAQAAQQAHRAPDDVLADLVNALPAPQPPLTPDEYDRRWEAFFAAAGSIHQGAPLTNDEVDELIGEAAAETHADASA